MSHDELLAGARRIAAEAAAWVHEHRPEGRVAVADTKTSDTDVVTRLDRDCEALIRRRLHDWRPDDAVLGEEAGPVGGTSGIEWIIDPIDGTVNFVYGVRSYAISLAARIGDEVVVGVVHEIANDEVFTAARGSGAHLWVDGHARRLTGPPPVPLGHLLVATGFHYTREIRTRQAAAVAALLPHVRDIRRIGAASVDLAALAAGRLDAYVEQGLHIWDHAAGGLIAAEAGLVVAGLDGPPDERLVMAAHADVAEEYFALVRRCGF